ncbi:hypothetical protein M0R45_023645 [Rubus argutus]|uniref:Uncharacterized protein n=1 Tax=Rubus argutus TaxID=59490 RepID=A0AAW1WRZ8_RUBAR
MAIEISTQLCHKHCPDHHRGSSITSPGQRPFTSATPIVIHHQAHAQRSLANHRKLHSTTLPLLLSQFTTQLQFQLQSPTKPRHHALLPSPCSIHHIQLGFNLVASLYSLDVNNLTHLGSET